MNPGLAPSAEPSRPFTDHDRRAVRWRHARAPLQENAPTRRPERDVAAIFALSSGHIQARRGQVVFGDPAPVKTCPACLSSDLPAAASRCKYCGTDQPVTAA